MSTILWASNLKFLNRTWTELKLVRCTATKQARWWLRPSSSNYSTIWWLPFLYRYVNTGWYHKMYSKRYIFFCFDITQCTPKVLACAQHCSVAKELPSQQTVPDPLQRTLSLNRTVLLSYIASQKLGSNIFWRSISTFLHLHFQWEIWNIYNNLTKYILNENVGAWK